MSHDNQSATGASSQDLSDPSTSEQLSSKEEPASPKAVKSAFRDFVLGYPWHTTELGDFENWPSELKSTVKLALLDTTPSIVLYGDGNTIIYNEAYVPVIGSKHPNALGGQAAVVFPETEITELINGVQARQRETEEAISGEASMFLISRRGFLEEIYFDWKFLPLIDDSGAIKGTYIRCEDRTDLVFNARWAACMRTLTQKATRAANLIELWDSTMRSLVTNGKDIPVAQLYVVDLTKTAQQDSQPLQFRFVASTDLEANITLPKGATTSRDIQPCLLTAMQKAVLSQEILTLESGDPGIKESFANVKWGGFTLPSQQFAVLPIRDGDDAAAVMVVGLNPHRAMDQKYTDMLQTIADILSPQITRCQLSKELKLAAVETTSALSKYEQSEMRFLKFTASSGVGFSVVDADGQLSYANDAWFDFFGKPMDPIGENSWRDFILDEDVPILDAWWGKMHVQKDSGTLRLRSKVPFGRDNMELPHKHGILVAYADMGKDGKVETVTGLVMDVSEQAYMQTQLSQRTQALEESERKYREFADTSPVGVIRSNADGEVIYANDAWFSLYGFNRDTELGMKPWAELMSDEAIAEVDTFFESLPTNTKPATLEVKLNKKYTIQEGDRIIEDDVWIAGTNVVSRDSRGEVNHFDFWVIDISAQKMAIRILNEKIEEANRNKIQQERFIDMISHEIRNPLSAVLHCAEEIIERMSETSSLLSISKDCCEKLCERMNPAIASALDAGNTIMYCVQHQKQIVDDVLTLSKLDSDLLVISPVPIHLMNLMKSAMKMFEAEVRISDINFKLVEDKSFPEHNISWLLLDSHRFLQVAINLITNAIKFTKDSAVREITITVSYFDSVPPRPNHINYAPQRYKSVIDSAEVLSSRDTIIGNVLYLRLSVSDTGRGLKENERKLLFNRFSQASPKTHIKYGGSGLGLFISRQITEMMGGQIGMGPSESGGCDFTFFVRTYRTTEPSSLSESTRRLSFSPSNPNTSMPVTPPSLTVQKGSLNNLATQRTVDPALRSNSRKILVVEDNLLNQKVLCKQLRGRGFEVAAANHGGEAIEALMQALQKGRYFDVVLCDIEMPVMDGNECAQKIRRLEDDALLPKRIPIIGVTANVRSTQVEEALRNGMDTMTTKPYRIAELVAAINQVLPLREISV